MKLRQIGARLLLCTLAGAASLAVSQAHAQTTQNIQATLAADFAEALELYQLGKWGAAYGRFVALADRDHPDAARIALFMHRFGPRMYASAWDASERQVERWLTLASRQMQGKTGAVGD